MLGSVRILFLYFLSISVAKRCNMTKPITKWPRKKAKNYKIAGS